MGGTPITAYIIDPKITANTISEFNDGYSYESTDAVTCDSTVELENRFCIVNGLTPSKNYGFKIWAKNIQGVSTESETSSPSPGKSVINWNFTIPTNVTMMKLMLSLACLIIFGLYSDIRVEALEINAGFNHTVAVWFRDINVYDALKM